MGITNNCQGLSRTDAFVKRTFDFVVASLGLLLIWWVIFIAYLIATFDTRRNGFFTQSRVGKEGRRFRIIKIRTMRELAGVNTTVTTATDKRITRTGKFFRDTKIDELPQLINVLLGQMSLVGPRADVPGFADCLEGMDRIILSVRPGITGPATLKYRDEEQMLLNHKDPEKYNCEIIYPDKVRINRSYVENYRFVDDLRYIWRTLAGEKVA